VSDRDAPRYEGAVNLTAMEAAVRYNAFLADRVEAAARGARSCLDFGAGLGTFARLLRQRGMDVGCVEPDPELAASLTRSAFSVHESLSAIPNESIPFIYSLNVLEHIADDVGTLAALRRCLVPGGRLYLYVPAFPILFSAMDEFVGHHRRYLRSDLTRRCEQAGFTVERAEYVDALGFFASLVYRLLRLGTGEVSRAEIARYDRWVFPQSLRLQPLLGRYFGKNLEIVVRRAP
jgi:SAM-dependent methyltransferase